MAIDLLRYLLLAALYAAGMRGIYALTLRRQSRHRISRIFLLLALALPGLFPLISLPAAMASSTEPLHVLLPAFTTGAVSGSAWQAGALLPVVYATGCAIVGSLYMYRYCNLRLRLRRFSAEQAPGYELLRNTRLGPGTIGRSIFIPGASIEPVILRHELAHIRAGHRFDLLLIVLSRVLLWPSPAHWLLGRELKTVHEFEADRVAAGDHPEVGYAALLLREQLGCDPASFISHSFSHHPLKRRIMMLQKQAPRNAGRLLALTVLLTAGFTGSMLYAQTKGSGVAASPNAVAAITTPLDREVLERNYAGPKPGTLAAMTGGQMVFTRVDKMPQFNGQLIKWLLANVGKAEQNMNGRCTVAFTIDQSGAVTAPFIRISSGNPRLDAEAIRVVRAMPTWKPGSHGGVPVAVQYDLPFNFEALGAGC